jgi:hypothetical protein
LPLALEALFEISLGSRFAIARLDDNRIYYSVPSRLIGEQLEARITGTTIEILHKGAHVASHARSHARRRHTRVPEHTPSAHRRYAEWTRGTPSLRLNNVLSDVSWTRDAAIDAQLAPARADEAQLLQQSLVGSPSRPDYQQIWVV